MRSVCVYCGSSDGTDTSHVAAARAVGVAAAARGLTVVYGGADRGCMGALADAALEAGTEVHGVIPRALVDLEIAHRGLTRLDVVETLHERKARMTELADGFAVLPGGHGTLDELFEGLTWLQLGIHAKPIALLDTDGFWDGLVAHLDRAVAAGFIRPAHRALLIVEPDVEALLDALAAWRHPGPEVLGTSGARP